MINLYVDLALRVSPDSTTQARQIRGHFRFLTDDRMVAIGPEMRTELYAWEHWLEWLSHDLEGHKLHQVGGLLHYPDAVVELGQVHLRMPNRTPFYLVNEDNETLG